MSAQPAPKVARAKHASPSHTVRLENIRNQRLAAQGELKKLRKELKQESAVRKAVHNNNICRGSAIALAFHVSLATRTLALYPLQENRRHKRLMKKASKLQIADLLEIAAMRGLRADAPEDEVPAEEVEAGTAGKGQAGGSSGSASKPTAEKTTAVPTPTTTPSSDGKEKKAASQ